MEKKLLIALAVLMLQRTGILAQNNKPEAPVKTGNEWKMPSDVFKRSKTYAADLQKKLQLDSVQTQKVYDLFLSNTKPLDEISVAKASDKEKDAMRKSNQSAFNEKMKGILSDKQYHKFLLLQQ